VTIRVRPQAVNPVAQPTSAGPAKKLTIGVRPHCQLSQIAHTKWYELFPDPTIVDAIMDRVIHNAYILALDSKISMREVMAQNIKTDY